MYHTFTAGIHLNHQTKQKLSNGTSNTNVKNHIIKNKREQLAQLGMLVNIIVCVDKGRVTSPKTNITALKTEKINLLAVCVRRAILTSSPHC